MPGERYQLLSCGTIARDVLCRYTFSLAQFLKNGNVPPLSLYIHIPFCAKRCRYCSYFSMEVSRAGELSRYRDYLFAMIEYFAPTFKDHRFRHIYIGGGTPTIFPDKMFREIIEKIFTSFSFSKDGTRSCEMNPLTATAHKIATLKQYGFTYVSFGVQTASPEVLQRVNRAYQTADMTEAFVEQLHRARLSCINADLLYGLAGDTPEGFLRSIDMLIRMNVPKISIIRLLPTPAYVTEVFKGTPHDCLEQLNDFARKTLPRVKELFAEHGYFEAKSSGSSTEDHVSSWVKRIRLKDPRHTYFPIDHFSFSGLSEYSDIPADNTSVFGLGPTARSHIFGELDYAAHMTRTFSFEPDEHAFQGKHTPQRHAMLRYMFISFKETNKVTKKAFRNIFNKHISEEFGPVLATLIKEKLIRNTRSSIELIPVENKKRFLTLLRFIDNTVHILPVLDLVLTWNGIRCGIRIEPQRTEQSYLFSEKGYGMFIRNTSPTAATMPVLLGAKTDMKFFATLARQFIALLVRPLLNTWDSSRLDRNVQVVLDQMKANGISIERIPA